MDQPLADAAFFPTYLLAREARRHVTVALSGEGGDELQAGYTRHRHESLLRIALKTGVPSFGFERFAPAQWRRQIGKLQSLRALETSNAYQTVMSLWNVDVPELAYKGFRDADTDFYLPHDLLMKLDGATMAHALEGRCPYLDPDLWGAVNALPRSAWQNKRQARALLHKYGLADVTSKGKKGLTLPLAAWLRRGLARLGGGTFENRCGGRNLAARGRGGFLARPDFRGVRPRPAFMGAHRFGGMVQIARDCFIKTRCACFFFSAF